MSRSRRAGRVGAGVGEDVVAISRRLREAVDALDFARPVAHVYNPLGYARATAESYLERYARAGVDAALIGMNPGPFGMAQTGVPFGEVAAVRDWLRIEGVVERPANEHPKRPILGFDCPRSEVSGRRLWGWARDRFGTPEAFFERFFVWNYCPLVFMEAGGRNLTPDKLPREESAPLFAACDAALVALVERLAPARAIGVGKFAEARARGALGGDFPVGTVLHPSPASPAANRGWTEQAEAQLRALGIEI